MKKIFSLIIAIFPALICAQSADITIFSQNEILANQQSKSPADADQIAAYPFISESYEIPAYGLYSRYWDTADLRGKILEIPFSNNRLMLMLVQDANNPFAMPCSFNRVKNTYGTDKKNDFHPGVDLLTEAQTLVKSCFDGVVRLAINYGAYGNTVVVRHYNGLETVYSNLGKVCVRPMQIIKAGQVLGQMGNLRECVLHFETRLLNEHFDPELIIDFEEEDLLQNNIALMSRDFNIIPLDSFDVNRPTLPKPTVKPQPKPIVNKTVKEENKIEEQFDNGGIKVEPKVSVPGQDDSQSAVYHTVKSGENLYRISVKYNTTVDNILNLNNLKNADHIVEGQKLRVK